MRIAMMTNNYKPIVGGVPISIERLAQGLRARGHDVDIFAPTYPGQTPENGVIRYRTYNRKPKNGLVIPNIFDADIDRRFDAKAYDLVHTHHPTLIGYRAWQLSRRHKLPLALTYHTRYEQYLHHLRPCSSAQKDDAAHPDNKQKHSLLANVVTAHNRIFINRCHNVFVPGQSMKEILEQMGVTTPIHILPTGLSPSDFSSDTDIASSLRRRYAPHGENLFCSVARLEKEKNIPFLLRAMAAYKARSQTPFRLLVIGEGSQKDALQQYAARLGLGSELIFTGCIPHTQLNNYYAACDAFLFSSQSETQGVVLLEAMAVGLPVVAVAASGVNDVVNDGVNGFLSPLRELDFASILGQLAGSSQYRTLCQNARATAKAYTASQIAQRAETLYMTLLHEQKRASSSDYANGYAYAH